MVAERLPREVIAMRVAQELQDGDVVNLGIGIPSLCSQFVPEGRTIFYHSESGVLNYGPMAEEGEEDQELTWECRSTKTGPVAVCQWV